VLPNLGNTPFAAALFWAPKYSQSAPPPTTAEWRMGDFGRRTARNPACNASESQGGGGL